MLQRWLKLCYKQSGSFYIIERRYVIIMATNVTVMVASVTITAASVINIAKIVTIMNVPVIIIA